jgi:hypothetical protein
MQESNYLSNDFLTKINEIKDKMKTDISLMKEFMQHMNRKFNRNEDEFLTNNISIIQIGLIRKEMNDLKNEINIILDSLNEIKEIKKELGELNKNILFEII